MELSYKGSFREFRGILGVLSTSFESKVDLTILNKKINTAVHDTYICVNQVNEDEVDFSVFYFDKETRYIIHKGENLIHKYEGNAFGFEMNFILV